MPKVIPKDGPQNDHHRDEAYTLDTPDQHRDYYDNWAQSYDDDFVMAEGYAAPHYVAEIFASSRRDAFPLADIGCGTGLVGQALRRAGVDGIIHGFDISTGMMQKAETHKSYDRLIEADITAPLTQFKGEYGGLISAGTFTLGHLAPPDLENTFSLVRHGGLALISINAVHFEQKGFAEAFKTWQDNGLINQPIWHKIDLYFNPEDVEAESKAGLVAEFKINFLSNKRAMP